MQVLLGGKCPHLKHLNGEGCASFDGLLPPFNRLSQDLDVAQKCVSWGGYGLDQCIPLFDYVGDFNSLSFSLSLSAWVI